MSPYIAIARPCGCRVYQRLTDYLPRTVSSFVERCPEHEQRRETPEPSCSDFTVEVGT